MLTLRGKYTFNNRQMGEVRAKKFLGQHFLKDLQIAKQIADSIENYSNLPVIEVGPGMGVLTQYILQNDRDLTVIELDKESIPYLQKHFPQLGDKIIEGDFLELKLEDIYAEQFCLIGNYPYNISSQIFFKLLDYKDQIPCCSGMLQKEVAERLASKPGNKSYGILSVLLQAWYDVEYLFTVSEQVFDPPPKVKSAVIKATRNQRTQLGCDEKLFKHVIKTSFNQRRKTLRNSMKAILGKDNEAYKNDELFNKRPEQLSVQDFVELTNITEAHLPKN